MLALLFIRFACNMYPWYDCKDFASLQIIFVNTLSDGIVLKIKLHFVLFCHKVFIN